MNEVDAQLDLETYAAGVAASARGEGERRALAVEDRSWADAAMTVIGDMSFGTTFDADHLRGIVGPPPTPNAIGAVIRAARRRGWIRCVGFGVSARPSRHAGVVRIWERTR